jgi:hypothetical protein
MNKKQVFFKSEKHHEKEGDHLACSAIVAYFLETITLLQ